MKIYKILKLNSFVIGILLLSFSCDKKNAIKSSKSDTSIDTTIVNTSNTFIGSMDTSDSRATNGLDIYDSVAVEFVTVRGVKIGDSEKKIMSILGQPDSVGLNVNEFDDSKFQEYFYENSSFYIRNHKVSGFTSESLPVVIKGDTIKMGDYADVLIKSFPNSVKSYEVNRITVKIRLGSSDEFICFGIHDNVIRSYRTWIDL